MSTRRKFLVVHLVEIETKDNPEYADPKQSASAAAMYVGAELEAELNKNGDRLRALGSAIGWGELADFKDQNEEAEFWRTGRLSRSPLPIVYRA